MASSLKVESITIHDLLEKLKSKEWLVPEFQRDFVWSTGNIEQFIVSIIETKPIGMVTLWAQPDDTDLKLEPLSIPDWINGKTGQRYFSDNSPPPKNQYAIWMVGNVPPPLR